MYAICANTANISIPFSDVCTCKKHFVLNSTEYDARQFNKLDQQTQVEFETDSSVMAKKLLELEG